jgi:chorismate dehydratase
LDPEEQPLPDGAVRVGLVRYLNARPLIPDLPARGGAGGASARRGSTFRDDGFVLTEHVPSEAARLLLSGVLDVALVPVTTLLDDPRLTYVPGVGIATPGRVDSVLLFHDVPCKDLRSVALDPASRASAALLQLLLEERHGARPSYVEVSPEEALSDRRHDGILVIGDTALSLLASTRPRLDLGLAWREWTGLPFVFAVWALKRELHEARPDIAARLRAMRDEGTARLSEIAETHAGTGGLDGEGVLTYLRDRISFRLGPEEERGLSEFLLRIRRRRSAALSCSDCAAPAGGQGKG